MNWKPWTFTNPYIPYTPIRAEEVNPNFNGISASFTYIADELNQFRPRLPANFTGDVEIPEGGYTNTVLAINEFGNMALLDIAALKLEAQKDFVIKQAPDQQITVDGNNHADWIIASHIGAVDENIVVVVNPATALFENTTAAAPGSTILFTQDTDTPLTFAPVPGVTVKSPGLLKAYGKHSTVTLMAVDQNTWVLGGDVAPAEVIV